LVNWSDVINVESPLTKFVRWQLITSISSGEQSNYGIINQMWIITKHQFFPGHGWLSELGSWITYNSYKPITNTAWVCTRLCKLQKRVHSTRSQQVIKFTNCLPMVGGSLRALRLLPPLKLVAMIYLKYCWKWR
jgi:hypothetical protein